MRVEAEAEAEAETENDDIVESKDDSGGGGECCQTDDNHTHTKINSFADRMGLQLLRRRYGGLVSRFRSSERLL